MTDNLLEAYTKLCMGYKIKTKNNEYSYKDIKGGKAVTFDDFIEFIKKVKEEEPPKNYRYVFARGDIE